MVANKQKRKDSKREKSPNKSIFDGDAKIIDKLPRQQKRNPILANRAQSLVHSIRFFVFQFIVFHHEMFLCEYICVKSNAFRVYER